MILKTERLILRGPKADDLDDYFAIHASPEAMKYWFTPPHTHPDETKARLDRLIYDFNQRKTFFMLEHNGRSIGSAGVRVGHEIGFILHPDFHRQGFGTEALSVIIPHVWKTTDLDYLIADVDPRNTASLALLGKFGFTESHRAQNTFQIGETWVHSIYLRLNRGDDVAT